MQRVNMTYTCSGSVRGSCGHKHRTVGAAERCRQRDADGCRSQGGYTDRSVCRTDGEPLDEMERADAEAAQAQIAGY